MQSSDPMYKPLLWSLETIKSFINKHKLIYENENEAYGHLIVYSMNCRTHKQVPVYANMISPLGVVRAKRIILFRSPGI